MSYIEKFDYKNLLNESTFTIVVGQSNHLLWVPITWIFIKFLFKNFALKGSRLLFAYRNHADELCPPKLFRFPNTTFLSLPPVDAKKSGTF